MQAAELARLVGASEATISRLASGERRPSIETMAAIEPVLRWSVDRQVDALRDDNYASEFKTRMERKRAGT